MPKFTTLEQAQRWIDEVGDQAVDKLLDVTVKTSYPPIIVRDPTDEEIGKYISRNWSKLHSIVHAADKNVTFLGLTMAQWLNVKRQLDLTGVSPDEIDNFAIIPRQTLESALEAIAVSEQEAQAAHNKLSAYKR